MSLTKSVAGMKYEVTGKKEITDGRAVERKAYRKLVEKNNSLITLAYIAYKHRVGLLSVGCIILLLNTFVPMWFQMFLGLIGR